MQWFFEEICEDMPLSKETKEEIAAQIAPLKERVDNYIKFFWAVSGFLVVCMLTLSSFLVNINSKVDRLPSSISASLINQAKGLSSAGKADDAKRALILAASLINSARAEKSRAGPSYFESASLSLKEIVSNPSEAEIHKEAYQTLLGLASYKTALATPPSLSGTEKSVKTPVTDPSFWKGASVLLGFMHGDMFVPPFERKLSDNIFIAGIVVIGKVPDARQTLDGIHWVDTVFVNMRIRYQGGEVELRNVRFINCTFEISQDPSGLQIAYQIATVPSGTGISQRVPA